MRAPQLAALTGCSHSQQHPTSCDMRHPRGSSSSSSSVQQYNKRGGRVATGTSVRDVPCPRCAPILLPAEAWQRMGGACIGCSSRQLATQQPRNIVSGAETARRENQRTYDRSTCGRGYAAVIVGTCAVRPSIFRSGARRPAAGGRCALRLPAAQQVSCGCSRRRWRAILRNNRRRKRNGVAAAAVAIYDPIECGAETRSEQHRVSGSTTPMTTY
jgi:hypothetical protein